MSKKFYAVHRETGERWKPSGRWPSEFLMMFDTGYLAVVKEDFYTHLEPLDPLVWELVVKDNLRSR